MRYQQLIHTCLGYCSQLLCIQILVTLSARSSATRSLKRQRTSWHSVLVVIMMGLYFTGILKGL
ncbi:hypothetical protein Goari_011942 [Gossypium aridum]|uniref:Uncharacterized protein n=1 Tax=Gossypium aridum TaxID=34290 RepID=A0A7J8WYY8_GOSAI|nr:hypothetical protein [Gossypium aridum]